MQEYLIGLVHILGMISLNWYGFLFTSNKNDFVSHLDRFFLLVFALVNISHMVFRGECIVSYFFKKVHDPTYIMGSFPHVYADFDVVLKKWSEYNSRTWLGNIEDLDDEEDTVTTDFRVLVIIKGSVLRLASFWIVFQRSALPPIKDLYQLFIPLAVMYMLYSIDMILFQNMYHLHRNFIFRILFGSINCIYNSDIYNRENYTFFCFGRYFILSHW